MAFSLHKKKTTMRGEIFFFSAQQLLFVKPDNKSFKKLSHFQLGLNENFSSSLSSSSSSSHFYAKIISHKKIISLLHKRIMSLRKIVCRIIMMTIADDNFYFSQFSLSFPFNLKTQKGGDSSRDLWVILAELYSAFIEMRSFPVIQDSRRMAKNYCGCCEIAAFILSWHEYSNFNQQEQIFEFSFNDFNRIFSNFYTMVSTLHALLIFVYFISIWFLFYICWKPRFYQAPEIENTKNFINFCFSYKICFLEWRDKKTIWIQSDDFHCVWKYWIWQKFFLISIQAKKWRRFPFFVVHKDF